MPVLEQAGLNELSLEMGSDKARVEARLSPIPCRAVPCRAVPCCAVLCCAVLCCAVLCRTVPSHAVPSHPIPSHPIPFHSHPILCRHHANVRSPPGITPTRDTGQTWGQRPTSDRHSTAEMPSTATCSCPGKTVIWTVWAGPGGYERGL